MHYYEDHEYEGHDYQNDYQKQEQEYYMYYEREPDSDFLKELDGFLKAGNKDIVALMKKHKFYYSDTPVYDALDVFNYASEGDILSLQQALNYGSNSINWYRDTNRNYYTYRRERDTFDYTALQVASDKGHEECVRILLNSGADVNIQTDTNHETALHCAARNGHLTIVALLLENGADMSIQSNREHQYGDEDFYYGTAFEMASFYDHLDIVTLLLDKGANMEGEALVLAAKNDCTEIAALLLDRGIDVNQTDYDGNTALIQATWRNNFNLVEMLLERGANTDHANDSNYDTALSNSIENGSIEMFQMLLKFGADINYYEGSALKMAAFEGQTVIVTMLLDRGVLIVTDINKYRPAGHGHIIDCRPMIIEEIENRKKRFVFDAFITHHIEYYPFIENIYTICYPHPLHPDEEQTVCRLTKSKPSIGWSRAVLVRDKYYFDEIFIYLYLHVAKVINRSTSSSCSIIAEFANNNDDTSTLMTILTDRLMMFLKPPGL